MAEIWGNITGTISNQTDLQSVLNSKASSSDVSSIQSNLQASINTKAASADISSLISGLQSSINQKATLSEIQALLIPPGNWLSVSILSSSVTLSLYNSMYLGNTLTSLTWVLPAAHGSTGKQIYVENIGVNGNTLAIYAPDGETIEEYTSIDLSDGIGMTFYSDGTNWRRLKF